MLEKREIRLSYIHISFRNMKNLSYELNKIHKDNLAKGSNSKIIVTIAYADGSTTSGDDIKLLSDRSAIENNYIQRITLTYHSDDDLESLYDLSITLFHGNTLYKNVANIATSDSEWIPKITKLIEDCLQPTHNLSNILTDHQKIFKYATALSFGFLCIISLETILSFLPLNNWVDMPDRFYEPYYSLPLFVYWPAKYALSFLVGLKFAQKLTDSLIYLYPLVDLKAGTHHKEHELQRQKLIITAISIWLAPFFISLVRIIIL